MVLASAGSGKTYQLGNRIIGFIAMGIDPATIVALTFTRKAAGEFTDAVLSKIAAAGLDEAKAAAIRADLAKSGRALGDVDFIAILESFVRALPHMTLGTMDGFFTKIVKAFPHELGISSGTFQLIEGAQAETMQENLLQSILQNELSAEEAQSFYEAFRKSLMGRESFTIRSRLSDYASLWHKEWRSGADALAWGPDALAGGGSVAEWNQQRLLFQEKLLAATDAIEFGKTKTNNDANHVKAWRSLCETFGNHSTGSGVIPKGGTLLLKIMHEIAQGATGSITLNFYRKDLTIPFEVVQLLSDCLLCAAKAEMANACESTQAVRDVIALYDDVCQRRLRQKGLFRFDDVKVLMGSWSQQEDQRLMREALDFRLHSQYGHWLLDEFQDTSRTDWAGLFPLIDEAATDDEGSLFIVGDKKQAIYGWRGGDVRLFDEIRERYQDRFAIETMPESYRSASEVLDLVNRVCGNENTLAQMYPTAAARWEWQEHTAARVDLRGHARVETIDCEDDDARLARMAELMHEIGIGTKALSCGVLVRTNQEMLDVADYLREEGFRVIEDGIRKPAQDNPLGVVLHQLLRWLADPADSFASETLAMSPLWSQLIAANADDPWSHAHRIAHEVGFAGLAEFLLNSHWDQLSAFGKNRALDLLQALRGIDQSAGASIDARCHTALTSAPWFGARRLRTSSLAPVRSSSVFEMKKPRPRPPAIPSWSRSVR
jgi:ATP-dependent exoDNAse (exonuclease V) beta subunit